MSESTKKTLQTIGVTATAVTAGVVALWKSFIDASMENEPIQKSFERLSESANIASDEMIKAMRKASKWTVSDTKLMSAANKAYSLWIVQSADDMATMMEIARVKGQAMWRTMEEALDDIVTWLWRWSAQILDNLWIVVKSSDAYEQYANSIWKAVGELTEEEKKLALVNAVVSQWKEELEAFGEVPLTMAERVAQLNTARENTQNTIGDALVPVFEKLLNVVQPIIDKIAEFVSNHAELVANVLIWIWAVAGLTAVFSWLALAIPTIATAISVLTWPIWMIIGAIWLLATAWINDRWWIRESTARAVEEIKWKIQPFLDWLSEFRIENGETIKTAWKEVRTAISNVVEYTMTGLWDYLMLAFESIWLARDTFCALLTWDRGKVKEDLESITNLIKVTLEDVFWQMRENIKWKFQEWIDRVVSKLERLTEKVRSIVWSIRNARESAKEAAQSAVSSATDRLTSLWKSQKAWWWVVQGGETYLVWEHGPELFTPSQSGRITPNNQITNNNGSVSININSPVVRSDDDIQRITDEIIRQIKLEKQFGIA